MTRSSVTISRIVSGVAFVALCLGLVSLAKAAPAVVTAPNAEAHAAADSSSAVVHVFHEGERLSVDEKSEAGWRRVRLPDGRVGFLPESSMSKPAVEPPFPTVLATVTVFELRAHERANEDAPVAGTFSEGAELKVSKERVHGWRRVLLDDGSTTAFVEEKSLKLPQEADEQPWLDETVAEARRSPSPKPNIFVKDCDHLAQLVKRDPLVYPMAARVAERHSTGLWTIGLTGFGGLALWLSSMSVLAHDGDCVDGVCGLKPNWLAFIAGATTAIVGPLVGLAILPSRNDVLDVMNRWNVRHPDEQFTWGSGPLNK